MNSPLGSMRAELWAAMSPKRAWVGQGSHALVLSPVPLKVPDALDGVSFDALRAGDRDGTLSWLWQRIDSGDY